MSRIAEGIRRARDAFGIGSQLLLVADKSTSEPSNLFATHGICAIANGGEPGSEKEMDTVLIRILAAGST